MSDNTESIIMTLAAMRRQESVSYTCRDYLYQEQSEAENPALGPISASASSSSYAVTKDCREKMAQWCYKVCCNPCIVQLGDIKGACYLLLMTDNKCLEIPLCLDTPLNDHVSLTFFSLSRFLHSNRWLTFVSLTEKPSPLPCPFWIAIWHRLQELLCVSTREPNFNWPPWRAFIRLSKFMNRKSWVLSSSRI